MADRLESILQECLELLRQNVPLEECLARYAEDAEELEPLLRAALTLKRQLTPGMPSEARARLRARVLTEWDRCHVPGQRHWGLPSFLPRWAAVAASVVLAIILGGAGAVTAASGAIPGDSLYPVKEVREGAQLWLARSPEAKVAIYSRLVEERVEELREVMATGRTRSSFIAVKRLEGHVADVNQLVEESIRQPADGSPAISPGLVTQLQEVVAGQRLVEGILQQTLQRAPAEARPGLQRALEAIQGGKARVRAALEAAGHPVP